MASLGEPKNSIFSGLGRLAVQVGRQKIPVVFTAVKKIPSNDASRAESAAYIRSAEGKEEGIFDFIGKYILCGQAKHPHTNLNRTVSPFAADFRAGNFRDATAQLVYLLGQEASKPNGCNLKIRLIFKSYPFN